MGSDMTCYIEVLIDGSWQSEQFLDVNVFEFRCRAVNDFFQEGETESDLFFMSYRGLPEDVSKLVEEKYNFSAFYSYLHGISWVLLSELLGIDYKKQRVFEDMFYDDIVKSSIEDYFPDRFFEQLEILKALPYDHDKIRIVFWFD